MFYKLNNQHLKLEISTLGGEMQSICTCDGTEYLWQGDENTWPNKAINIFPYVARLTNGKYTFNGEEYHMNPHGFLSSSHMTVDEISNEKLILHLTSNDTTRRCYPFDFDYFLIYQLKGKSIQITSKVINNEDENMYFGLGGHPGFNVPLECGTKFNDYFLEFADNCTPIRIGMSPSCFVTGEDTEFKLRQKKYLDLEHSLFDHDAIILKNIPKEVTLCSKKTNKAVRVTYSQMNFLGIWHWPKSNASYICIEPWTSLPSRQGVVEDFAKQKDLICLASKETYINQWKIEII